MKTRKKACKDLIDRIVEKFGLTKEKAETIVKFLFLEITKAEKW
jgi:nucleoid DNA-binding protein